MARTDLTFRIFGKDVNASKALKGVAGQAGRTGGKLSGAFAGLGGPAGIATVAAAGIAAVGVALFDAGKAAADDQKAAAKLAKTMKNVTGATDAQVASVEDYIDVTQRATGVSDDELRPAMESLIRATGDASKAQDLLTTAMDVAAGTGRPLETVALALSRAYSGNTAGLSRLGISMKDADGKALSFDAAMAKLNKQFGGQAQTAADTFDGKMKRVGVSLDELKEAVGAKVLPLMEKFGTWLVDDGIPALEALWATINTKIVPVMQEYLKPAAEAVKAAFDDMGKTIADNKQFFDDLGTIMRPIAAFAGGQMALSVKTMALAFKGATAVGVIWLGTFRAVKKVAEDVALSIGTAAANVAAYIRQAVSSIRSLWNSTIGGKGFTFPDWLQYLPGMGGLAGQTWKIPYLASGALVTGPTLAMIGEGRESEAVLPLSKLDAMMNGTGGGDVINVYITQPLGSKDAIARVVLDAVRTSRENGRFRGAF